MIRSITHEEFVRAESLLNSGALHSLTQDVEAFRRQIPDYTRLLVELNNTYNTLTEIINSNVTREVGTRDHRTLTLTPELARSESIKLILYTIIIIYNMNQDLRTELDNDMRLLLNMVSTEMELNTQEVPDIPEEVDHTITDEEQNPDDRDIQDILDDYDDMYDDEEEIMGIEDPEDTREPLIQDELVPEEVEEVPIEDDEPSEAELLARIREEAVAQALKQFTTIPDNTNDSEESSFEVRGNEPSYYKDIRRKSQWVQRIQQKQAPNKQLGIKVQDSENVVLQGWEADKNE